MAIELHHPKLDVTITVQTEAAAAVYKASGWKVKKQEKKEG